MCLNPIILKNGLCVPCGKCEICLSNRRNEWSIRLAIHLENCDRMPMFITLTYDVAHLPLTADGEPTLKRADVSKFLKAYKRKYYLRNEDFQYFGCGETGDLFGRPHYHLLFFGDFQLYDAFFVDSELAKNRIRSCWPHGHVHVGLAGFDGIHYVTKYCLKENINDVPMLAEKPFTIASNGLGNNLLKSMVGIQWKNQLEYLTRHKDKIMRFCPAIESDFSNLSVVLDYLRKYIPSFKVILSDGRIVYCPRSIRKKFIGSFEHFKDSPLWFYYHLNSLYESIKYYNEYAGFDRSHPDPAATYKCLNRLEKIRKRMLEKKYNLKFKQNESI